MEIMELVKQKLVRANTSGKLGVVEPGERIPDIKIQTNKDDPNIVGVHELNSRFIPGVKDVRPGVHFKEFQTVSQDGPIKKKTAHERSTLSQSQSQSRSVLAQRRSLNGGDFTFS
jgi:hypothetical protein